MELNIKDLIKNNSVEFDSYRQGHFYYKLFVDKGEWGGMPTQYLFPVPLDDIGTATLLKADKAITFMRWIRRAIEDKTLIEVK